MSKGTKIDISPVDTIDLSQAIAIVGRTGSGKTTTARGLVQHLFVGGSNVCVIDPTGVWWGLRLLADGKTPSGIEAVILGGPHADIPLFDTSGDSAAEMIASRKLPQTIVDLSLMSGGEQTRFLTDFLETLFTRNRGPLHLIMDEADIMAPQNPMPDTKRLKGATDKIVRRGRVKGFRPMMITQRPQVIDKSVLGQIATMITMQLTSPQDQQAIFQWMGASGIGGSSKDLEELPRLPVGVGFLWSPDRLGASKIGFPRPDTFDSSRAPDDGEEERQPVPLASLDLKAIAATMGELEPDADGPPAGRARKPGIIADKVKRQQDLTAIAAIDTAAAAARHQAEVAAAEQRGYQRGVQEERGRIGKAIMARLVPSLIEVAGGEAELTRMMPLLRVGDHLSTFTTAPDAELAPQYSQPTPEYAPDHPRPTATGDTLQPMTQTDHAAKHASKHFAKKADAAARNGLAGGAFKLFRAIDTNPPVKRTWAQVATLAGLKPRGGHFNTAKKVLLERGLVRQEGELVSVATPSADAPKGARSPAELVELWAGVLDGAAPKILRELYAEGGTMNRAALAAQLGIKPVGGHWNTAWKQLRDNNLVTTEGETAHLTEMFRA